MLEPSPVKFASTFVPAITVSPCGEPLPRSSLHTSPSRVATTTPPPARRVAGDRRRPPDFPLRAVLPPHRAARSVGSVDGLSLRTVIDRVSIDGDAADHVVSDVADPARVAVLHVQREDVPLQRRYEYSLA